MQAQAENSPIEQINQIINEALQANIVQDEDIPIQEEVQIPEGIQHEAGVIMPMNVQPEYIEEVNENPENGDIVGDRSSAFPECGVCFEVEIAISMIIYPIQKTGLVLNSSKCY